MLFKNWQWYSYVLALNRFVAFAQLPLTFFGFQAFHPRGCNFFLFAYLISAHWPYLSWSFIYWFTLFSRCNETFACMLLKFPIYTKGKTKELLSLIDCTHSDGAVSRCYGTGTLPLKVLISPQTKKVWLVRYTGSFEWWWRNKLMNNIIKGPALLVNQSCRLF